MKIYVLRHEKRFSNPTFNTSLTNRGLHDAKKLALILQKYTITDIYTSPFKRIIQTVEPYLLKTGFKINIDYSLNESLYEGEVHESDIRPIQKNMYGYKYINLDYSPVINYTDLKFPELYNDVKKRTNTLLDVLITKNENKNILLVTHMTCVNSLLGRNSEELYPQGGLSLIYDVKSVFKPINF